MSRVDEILNLPIKPKEKQVKLVEEVISGKIPIDEFIEYFETTKDVNKGNCADAMKHISAQKPELLAPYIDILINYINYKLPRVKWGVPEAIGNMAKDYPQQVEKTIPYLLKNTTDNVINTTVIKWCAAYALGEIVKNNQNVRAALIPQFEAIIKKEKNSGVKNVYVKALKAINKNK